MSGKPEMSDKNQNLVKTFSGSHIFQFVKQIYEKKITFYVYVSQ